LKKKKIQNIIIIVIIILIIGSIIAYNYSVDQNKQKGLEFGNELKQIQEDQKKPNGMKEIFQKKNYWNSTKYI
jgi:uncharacterized protein YpmB